MSYAGREASDETSEGRGVRITPRPSLVSSLF